MKKVLYGLLGLLLAAALAAVGFVVFKGIQQQVAPQSNKVDAVQTPQGQPEMSVFKKVESDADVLDALDYYHKKNPDTVGWLRIPRTDINNSVLQSHNNTAYLHRNENREEDIYGCYFADYEASIGSREEMSANTVIYGHSDLKDNPDGKRFSQLFRYLDPQFAKENPYIEFSTSDSFMDWEVFAVFYPNISLNYIKTELTGPELTALAQEAMNQSIYDYGVTVGENDKILTLSTCTIKYGVDDKDHRFVVMAKLVPEGEKLKDYANVTPKTPDEKQTEG